MKVTAEQLIKNSPQIFKFLNGNLHTSASRPFPPESKIKGSLAFAADPEKFNMALQIEAHIIIATKKAIPAEYSLKNFQVVLETTALPLAMAAVHPYFDQKFSRFPDEIHSTAVIDETAKIGKDVRIGAYSVIGENAVIGEGSVLGPHCVIEKNAKLGSACLLHAFVFVGADCEVGNNCELHAHVNLGADGFGFVPRDKQSPLKIPQLGKVVLEDDVEIGGNCVIDRGTLTETRICKSTKLDNLCHIAHNCKIGANSLLAAGFMTAGSSEIGANFMCGGDVVVADHIHITDGVTVGGRGTVTNDITEPGAYTGYPLVPMREGLKYLASLPMLPELRKQISEIRKHLGFDKL